MNTVAKLTFSDLHNQDADNFQNLMLSSLPKDTSRVKFSRKSVQYPLCEVANRQTNKTPGITLPPWRGKKILDSGDDRPSVSGCMAGKMKLYAVCDATSDLQVEFIQLHAAGW